MRRGTPYGGVHAVWRRMHLVRRDVHATKRETVVRRGADQAEGRARRMERRTALRRDALQAAPLMPAQQTAPLVWGAVAALPAGLPSVHQIILGTGQARPDGASRGSAARGCPAAVPGQLVRATFLCRILADGNP